MSRRNPLSTTYSTMSTSTDLLDLGISQVWESIKQTNAELRTMSLDFEHAPPKPYETDLSPQHLQADYADSIARGNEIAISLGYRDQEDYWAQKRSPAAPSFSPVPARGLVLLATALPVHCACGFPDDESMLGCSARGCEGRTHRACVREEIGRDVDLQDSGVRFYCREHRAGGDCFRQAGSGKEREPVAVQEASPLPTPAMSEASLGSKKRSGDQGDGEERKKARVEGSAVEGEVFASSPVLRRSARKRVPKQRRD